LIAGIENGKHDPLESTTVSKADGAQENGITSAHHGDSAVCEQLNEANDDGLAKLQVNGSVNDVNITHEVAVEDAANGHTCELKKGNSTGIIRPGEPVFLVKSWRSQLCRCPSCLRMYEGRGLGFLLDSDDTLQVLPRTFLRWLYGSLSLILLVWVEVTIGDVGLMFFLPPEVSIFVAEFLLEVDSPS